MERPKEALISITWLEEGEHTTTSTFDETSIEQAIDLLSLMAGLISEEDLKP